jgi:hypothetical protein
VVRRRQGRPRHFGIWSPSSFLKKTCSKKRWPRLGKTAVSLSQARAKARNCTRRCAKVASAGRTRDRESQSRTRSRLASVKHAKQWRSTLAQYGLPVAQRDAGSRRNHRRGDAHKPRPYRACAAELKPARLCTSTRLVPRSRTWHDGKNNVGKREGSTFWPSIGTRMIQAGGRKSFRASCGCFRI